MPDPAEQGAWFRDGRLQQPFAHHAHTLAALGVGVMQPDALPARHSDPTPLAFASEGTAP